MPMTLAEVARLTGGELIDAAPGALLSAPPVVDSRLAVPGCLFVALPGEHLDGADFAAAAIAGGAVAVLIDRRLAASERGPGLPAVVVPDPVAALGRLARGVLDRLPGPTVVGVTGSAGKTSTKDLIAVLLARLGTTVAAAGSWNNEIGLPLTVLRADAETRYLALEYSARGLGHIAALCAVAPPKVGVVLNVGSAHVGVFGSRAHIAQAKGELLEALPPNGLAVLNADDPLVMAMAPRTAARVITTGTAPEADVAARDVRLNARGQPAFRLVTPAGSAPVQLRLYGAHQVSNALASAAVAVELGLDVAETAAGLEAAAAASRWRMEVSEAPGGVTVVNDAYNANPESMRAALRALVAIGRPEGEAPRRCWAVLGFMAELGDTAPDAHRDIGCLAGRLGVDRVLAVGPETRPLASAASALGAAAETVADADAATGVLRAELAPGDVVLIKASRAAGLERVAAALLEPASEPASESTA